MSDSYTVILIILFKDIHGQFLKSSIINIRDPRKKWGFKKIFSHITFHGQTEVCFCAPNMFLFTPFFVNNAFFMPNQKPVSFSVMKNSTKSWSR